MKNVFKIRRLISVMLAVILCVGILPTFISPADPVDETTVTITQSITFNVVGNKADIVFVIDATGSMGSYIKNVQENLKVFTDILDSGNVDYRIAVITYWDTTVSSDPATKLLTDAEGNYWFTSSDEVGDILETFTLERIGS